MATTTHSQTADWVGQSIKRKEDARLVRGNGKFVDDIKMLGMLHLVFVRSPYAHANITSVDVSEAEALPGVVCTLTGPEISKLVDPFFEIGPAPSNRILDYPMAVDRARYQGEPVAAVIAETPAIAEDAAELVRVEYEPLHGRHRRRVRRHRSDHPARHHGDQRRLARRLRVRRPGAGFCRSRARHPHRSSAHASLLQHAAGKQCRHRAVGRQRSAPLFLEQQFFSDHRHSVARARAASAHGPGARADARHRRQLRHQDHQLSADGGLRAGFAQGQRRAHQVDRDALRAHDLQRARQRAHLSRHPRGPRQERRHPRRRFAAHRRLRRLSALRAAGLRHLVAGDAGNLSAEKHAHRLHARSSPTNVPSAPIAAIRACSTCGSWSACSTSALTS